MANYIITVTKFNNIVKDIFNSEELLHNIKIVGEVFGVSKSKQATYFSLKDEESTLPCVTFLPQIMEEVSEGKQVVLTGSPNFYTKSGRFNFVVNKVEPYGEGILYQRFVELKNKLEKEGLFDVAHKKQIPSVVKRIGVVTSKDGAVIQDIKNVSWRRDPQIDIVLFDTKVQGNGAEYEIAKGIQFFSHYDGVDVVVVARGGGSLEDLSAYNTEIVARATFECQKPIVSAVGHETDFTIIDFVSDLRAPTPSAAAELLTKDTKNVFAALKKDVGRVSRLLDDYVADKNFQFQNDKRLLVSFMEDFCEDRQAKLEKLKLSLGGKLENFVTKADFELKLKLARLDKLNPLDILRLGYAKIEEKGKPISKLSEILGSEIEINMIDGQILAEIKEKKK